MESLLELATQSGIWAVMFVLLFLYQITDSKKREEKYQTTIKELGESLKIVGEIKENVEIISKLLTGGKSENTDDTK